MPTYLTDVEEIMEIKESLFCKINDNCFRKESSKDGKDSD